MLRGLCMDILTNCAKVYSKYADYDYTFVLDCAIEFTTAFRAENFHHLIGLQYLSDIKQVTKRTDNGAVAIYKKILNGKISQSLIEKSKFYSEVHERLLRFCKFDEIISSKLIVDFDYSKVPNTKILSKYLLYKQYDDGYAILGLRYDTRKDLYIPETFFFEKTDYYIRNQVSYNVIDVIATHYKDTVKI